MGQDILGNPVTSETAAVLAGVDAFVESMLAYEARAVDVIAVADAHPDACLINAYAAILHLLAETPDAPTKALPYLRKAQAVVDLVSRREASIVSFVAAWLEDDLPRATALGESVLRDHPRDLLMLKLLHYHAFNQGRFTDMLRLAQGVAAANADVAYLHGMLAFAYEQCHLLDAAEASARRALVLKAKEPWAQHALAHVMLTQGRIAEGAAFLDGVREGWTGLNSFMLTHLWWHLALFRLSQGCDAAVLDIYDQHCWGVAKDYSQDQIGAVSLLARLELAGLSIGDRWRDLGAYLAARKADTLQPFLSLQYLYGLARAGRPEADDLHAAIRDRTRTAPDYARETWAEIALPIADALITHARGDYEPAVRQLTPVLPRLADIGGSHAQRDLFDLILLDALIKSGRFARAQQVLELRRAADPGNVPVNRQLAHVYAALGLPKASAEAAARVRSADALSRGAA
jgi:tetratricopeptide (TPR) repeat protein